MRYFLDTEFNGFEGDLISIALVPIDRQKPPFYRVVTMDKPVVPWVAENVIPKLQTGGIIERPRPKAVVGQDLAHYLREAGFHRLTADALYSPPSIVADWPTDFTHLLDLLITGPGRMGSVPNFTMEFVRLSGFNTADHSRVPHNALADAIALRDECVRRFRW